MISCEEYDYIDIACLFRYLVKITMSDGKELKGVARDTRRNSENEECVLVSIDDTSDTEELVVLEDIVKLEACVTNPHFAEVIFDR